MRLKTGRVSRGVAPAWALRVSLVVARRGIRKLTGSRGAVKGVPSLQRPLLLESGNWELVTGNSPWPGLEN